MNRTIVISMLILVAVLPFVIGFSNPYSFNLYDASDYINFSNIIINETANHSLTSEYADQAGNATLWNGYPWSDVRWLNIDGGNANQNIDIGSYNISASWFNGLFNWTSGDTWTEFNGSYLIFNETMLATRYYNATSNQTVAGTNSGGDLEDTQHSTGNYDGTTMNFTEQVVAPALDIRFNFTDGLDSFNQGIIRYKTSTINGASPIIQVFDYATETWEDYPTLGESTIFTTTVQEVFDSTDHIRDGTVRMRIYKAGTGNINNKYYIDWLAITKGFGTPTGQEVDPYAIHKDGSTEWEGNEQGYGYNSTNWSWIDTDYINVTNQLCNSTGSCFTLTELNQTGGGSGTPAGADTNVQFNDGGSFGGSASLTFDKTTNITHIGNTNDYMGFDPAHGFSGGLAYFYVTTDDTGFNRDLMRLEGSSGNGASRFVLKDSNAIFAANAYGASAPAGLTNAVGFFAGFGGAGDTTKNLIIGHTETTGTGHNLQFFTSNHYSAPELTLAQDGTFSLNYNNKKFKLGANGDASMYYDGTDLVLNPREVGTGAIVVNPDSSNAVSLISNENVFIASKKASGSLASRALAVVMETTDTTTASGRKTALNAFAYHTDSGALTNADESLFAGRYGARLDSAGSAVSAGGVASSVIITNGNTGTITHAREFYGEGVDAEDGTITNAYGFYSSAHLKDTGTLNNAYGIYLEAQTAGSTSNWGIYDEGNDWFTGGNLSIGGNITVQGNLGLTGNYTNGNCWNYYTGGIVTSTNCTAI